MLSENRFALFGIMLWRFARDLLSATEITPVDRPMLAFELPRFLPVKLRVGLIAFVAAMLVSLLPVQSSRATETQSLEIITKSGVQVFTIEMAVTDEERMKGLMYRKSLAEGRGMLFDFSPEQNVQMWMKNTYIPLDMIFIRTDGTILSIAQNTQPLSEKIISSGGLAKGVLEVAGGTARKLGIAPGDRVAHPLFGSR